MVQSNIKKIYELLHSPILTPYNLLENVKLDNYRYVNYYKGEIGVVCEMKCIDQVGEEILYYYHFDNNDHLYRVFMGSANGSQVEVFNRDGELSNEVKKFSIKQSEKIPAI